jgi:cell division protease FtsH
MDKFANEDEGHKNAEEYVTIQSCIDGVKDLNVFVVATTNDIRALPDSLIRAGRVDQIIRIDRPDFNDAVKIIKHYLKDKPIMSDIDPDYIAKLMCRRSCATIESIINQAATIAGFGRRDKIELSDFIEAASSTVFRHSSFECCKKDIDLSDENSLLAEIVYHEAGHVVTNELLVPESVTLTAIGERNGYTTNFPGLTESDVREDEVRIISLLGGIAAVEQVYGRKGFGGSRDLSEAQRNLDWFLRDFGKYGFGFVSCPERRPVSETLQNNREVATSAFLEAYYEKTKKIIALNREFLEKIAAELAEKKILTMYDIQRIKKNCHIKEVNVL